ncbi:FdhF/YdeP family oxidoreductase [Desertifilum sp. FACHB-1129]|uniref:Oxidoreductase n=1 Tax=Desertifilum tharense IPPAS B-1220 TaxID=1781255 RepID=A0A1E5QL28_9CYAN|nr:MULTISPECIES: FdhF/YdeP family oxidoreductase [Desertifilum]MDA0212844.1 FdhF/YdeP family oxidoreductase [Cyanobacteria bacterium FC1]MBD2314450.1 FdhF/YdeP family oxidoreductase [Desertifilum sp. FACHB-1129]MBD2321699.1 FdhF/YdeP family oxidoreductase [Desertifilum sp. FACHB-866]MBD2331826.1 FdhF/YdeP family oxidoreductase [Desertifilum sp. FACHB-868]OEJ75385.1 oxidoreductase [Desertifilum tharense IPPAS B-1220]
MEPTPSAPQPIPPFHETNDATPDKGGGLPAVQYWAEHTLSPEGPKLWQTLLHKSACLSCAWGTGGQQGGFTNELGEKLQRCMKSVESISAELQPGIVPQFFEQHTLAELQQLTSLEADRLGRWSFPVILRAGKSHYERIAWEDVYQIAETAFRQPPERVASYSSGRSSNEAAYLLQLMIRALGSNNLADCSDLCHAPSTVGLKQIFGTGTSTVSLESLKQADCVVLTGSNASYNHPRLMNELIQLRDRGGKVIIINPVMEVGLVKFGSPAFPIKSLLAGSDISSVYLQPIPGSDVALFVGLQKSLLEQGFANRDFLQASTENWQAVVEQAQTTSWDSITQTCGISYEEITVTARMIGTSNAVVFAWAMGITQQENSVDNVRSIANTALLSGNVGKPGAGVMPIRGHSNVQGFGSMGVTVRLKKEIQDALEKLLGHSLSRVPGYDARALIEAADSGNVDTLICVGGNLYAANPDLTQAKRALGRIKTIIYLATKPNLGHFHGLAAENTIVIPVFNRFETPHKTTVESGNNFVRLNDEGKTHVKGDLISEVEFLTELAYRLFGTSPLDWRKLQDTQYVRQLIAQTIPGFEKMATIDATQEEFTIGGRIITEPKFPTPSGKAQMFATPLPQLSLPEPAAFGIPESAKGVVVALMTGRSYSQHNTVVYKEGDRYRGMPHRNCILMNRQDAQKANFQEHQRVTVQGDAGKMENVEVIFGAVREGAALMFYPEVNAIFKARIEKRSGTPAYKRVPVVVF